MSATVSDFASGRAQSVVTTHWSVVLAGMTYHYPLVATNHGGISLGTNQMFTTVAVALHIDRFEVLSNGRFRLAFTGTNGTACTVLASTNLATWSALGAAWKPHRPALNSSTPKRPVIPRVSINSCRRDAAKENGVRQ
jgi:hypothetical protein